MEITLVEIYPEEFRRKEDAEKYREKGTCAVRLQLEGVELYIKNITYRIDHEGKILIKPPFRVYSNKKKGQKPKLVPSIEFKNVEVWPKIEDVVKSKLEEEIQMPKKEEAQLDFFETKEN